MLGQRRGVAAVVEFGDRTVSMIVSETAPSRAPRSEEHTSELQSQSNLVCRLLLEKKKKNQIKTNKHITGSFKQITFRINRPQPTKTLKRILLISNCDSNTVSICHCILQAIYMSEC